jgi:hypothetical protein
LRANDIDGDGGGRNSGWNGAEEMKTVVKLGGWMSSVVESWPRQQRESSRQGKDWRRWGRLELAEGATVLQLPVAEWPPVLRSAE